MVQTSHPNTSTKSVRLHNTYRLHFHLSPCGGRGGVVCNSLVKNLCFFTRVVSVKRKGIPCEMPNHDLIIYILRIPLLLYFLPFFMITILPFLRYLPSLIVFSALMSAIPVIDLSLSYSSSAVISML